MQSLFSLSLFGALFVFSCADNSIEQEPTNDKIYVKEDGAKLETRYDDGSLQTLWFLKDGKKDSIFLDYYKGGKICRSGYWKEGKEFGNQYLYGADGDISLHSFYGREGLLYLKDYDQKSKYESQEFTLFFVDLHNTEIRANDSLQFEVFFACPDSCEQKLQVLVRDERKKIVDQVIYEKVSISKSNTSSCKIIETLRNKGEYNFELIYTMKDFKDNSVATDTNDFVVRVK